MFVMENPSVTIQNPSVTETTVLSHSKTRVFRDQILENTCSENRFCTGSGRRTPALQIAQNLYGALAPPVAISTEFFERRKKNKKMEKKKIRKNIQLRRAKSVRERPKYITPL
jgi:hypothetical protein